MTQPESPKQDHGSRSSWLFGLPIIILASAAVGAFAMKWSMPTSELPLSSERATPVAVPISASDSVSPVEPTSTDAAGPESINTLVLPKEKWEASGIELQPARRGELQTTVRLTGKVELNQDRIAHIFPMVEGAVESVSVSLGGTVKTDELLAVIHSREIGEAKLSLYQARLQLEMASTKKALQDEVSKNVSELLASLRDDMPIVEIESAFRNRPMGDYRERVLAAYSNFLKSSADVARLQGVADSGAVSGKQLLTAEANRNADQATYQSRIEQIEYELSTSTLLSSQAVKEAETQVAVAETSLRILGCSEADLKQVDPMQQGERISHYSIRAPFDGTVLTKDVVLSEQVRPDVMLLSIADLSTVWITADIYEEHVPLLSSLANQTIRFHNEAWHDQVFEASVFYTGEIMDEATRTISMRAVAENKDHLLKPGMFVAVDLPGAAKGEVLQVPVTSLQEHEGKQFVFVHRQDDQFEVRPIQVGQSNEVSVEIRDGLEAGESVVAKGGFILKSQMLAELMGEE